MRCACLVMVVVNAVLFNRIAAAVVIAEENFSYSSAAPLDTQTGGFGFSGSWTTGNGTALPAAPGARTIQPGNLGFGATGNHVFINSGGENNRDLAGPLGAAGTTQYFSFTVRPDSVVDADTSVGLILGGSSTRIFVGKPNVGAAAHYVIEQAGGAGQLSSAVAAVQGSAAFMVVRADFTAGNDTFRLYMNPPFGGPEPAIPDATLNAFDVGSLTYLGINSFGAVQQPLITGMNSSLGEIRIGTTFADVVPEPSTLGLSLFGVWAAFSSRRRWPD